MLSRNSGIHFFGSVKALFVNVRLSGISARVAVVTIALLSLSIAGCSVQPTTVVPAASEQEASMQDRTQSSAKQPSKQKAYEPTARTNTAYLSPAAKELVAKAKRYSGSGDTASALRYLERAQRISPRAPQVYLAMAEVRLQQGETSQARQLANKALSLVGDDEDLKLATELFIDGL